MNNEMVQSLGMQIHFIISHEISHFLYNNDMNFVRNIKKNENINKVIDIALISIEPSNWEKDKLEHKGFIEEIYCDCNAANIIMSSVHKLPISTVCIDLIKAIYYQFYISLIDEIQNIDTEKPNNYYKSQMELFTKRIFCLKGYISLLLNEHYSKDILQTFKDELTILENQYFSYTISMIHHLIKTDTTYKEIQGYIFSNKIHQYLLEKYNTYLPNIITSLVL